MLILTHRSANPEDFYEEAVAKEDSDVSVGATQSENT